MLSTLWEKLTGRKSKPAPIPTIESPPPVALPPAVDTGPDDLSPAGLEAALKALTTEVERAPTSPLRQEFNGIPLKTPLDPEERDRRRQRILDAMHAEEETQRAETAAGRPSNENLPKPPSGAPKETTVRPTEDEILSRRENLAYRSEEERARRREVLLEAMRQEWERENVRQMSRGRSRGYGMER